MDWNHYYLLKVTKKFNDTILNNMNLDIESDILYVTWSLRLW